MNIDIREYHRLIGSYINAFGYVAITEDKLYEILEKSQVSDPDKKEITTGTYALWRWGNGTPLADDSQELQTWRDFDKWLREVALGEEQYCTLMAEFRKDYKGITKHASSTYTSNEDEMKCANCKRRMDLWKYDYGKGGCTHEKLEGFACLAFANEGEVVQMVGTEGVGCEMFAPKEVEE